MRARGWSLAALMGLLVLAGAGGASVAADEPGYASPWQKEHTTAVRLIGGGHQKHLYAGIEIALDEGWKTYWRNPGSSGVPPRVDWKGSENVAEATLLFPAPVRFQDKEGDTVGYKKSVVLPVSIKPQDPAKPIVLNLALEYGVCRDVCIPVQPNLTLTLPPDAAAKPAGSALGEALAKVPRAAGSRLGTDPIVKAITVELTGPKPLIRIDAEFPGSPAGADVFLEAPDGLWIPLAKTVDGGVGNVRRFEVDLTDGADIADLKGRTIRLTVVSAAGQSEATFKLE